MPMPTSNQTQSVLRHVYNTTATITAVAIFFGLKPDLANAIAPAVHQIGEGVASIVAGVTALIPVATGVYAFISSGPLAGLLRMNANPEIEKVKAVPGTPTAALAATIPGNKVS